jgi:hypothetical protein
MQGPIFSVPFVAQSVTAAAQDLFELATGANSRIAICGIDVGQYSDAGDAAAELLGVSIIRGHTTTGDGTAATPINFKPWSRSSTVVSKTIGTTLATGGSPVTAFSSSFNIQAGFLYRPRFDNHFDERIWVAESSRVVVRITAPADAVTASGTIWFQETGLMSG